ncbi:MAG: endolytic transglycosylase MltG, partial [Candidatus Acidiferrales bacterium]
EFDGAINVSDLERESPYNTYRVAGLPPGPIASPGRAALAAALKPPKSDYLFFVSNLQGGHHFAATAAEHSRNVARFRRQREREQRTLR